MCLNGRKLGASDKQEIRHLARLPCPELFPLRVSALGRHGGRVCGAQADATAGQARAGRYPCHSSYPGAGKPKAALGQDYGGLWKTTSPGI